MIHNEEEVRLTRRQSSFLIASCMGCMMVLMIVAYVAGYRAAVAEHIAGVEKKSFADQIFTSAHETTRDSGAGWYYVLVQTYGTYEEKNGQEAVAYWQKKGISLMLRKQQRNETHVYVLSSAYMKKYEAEQLIVQLSNEDGTVSPKLMRLNEQVKGA